MNITTGCKMTYLSGRRVNDWFDNVDPQPQEDFTDGSVSQASILIFKFVTRQTIACGWQRAPELPMQILCIHQRESR